MQPAPVSRLTITSIALAGSLVPLSSTMIAVALPRIADDFEISTGRAGILITVYLAAMLGGQPIAGRLSDALGARRTALGALAGFGLCCIAAMVSGTFAMLMVARTGQAVFASALAPSAQSMIRTIVPADQRGRAFGLFGAVMGVGAGTGPVVGGLVIAGLGWHGIFAVNLPVVALSMVVFWRLPDDRAAVRAERAGGTGREPIANRTYSLSFGNQAFSTMGQYALLLIVPIILDARGWGTVQIGLVLASLTVGMIVMSPIGGRLGDRSGGPGGRRLVIVVGTAVTVVSLTAFAFAGPGVAVAVLVPMLICYGVGLGAVTPNLTTLALESVPATRVGLAAGTLSMSRYVGSIAASIALGLLVGDGVEGVGSVVWIAAVVSVLALASAVALPRSSAGQRGGEVGAHGLELVGTQLPRGRLDVEDVDHLVAEGDDLR
jgi:MFS family permease